jgi:hypothetical protein
MKPADKLAPSRRDFLKNTGKAAAVTALASMTVPAVHAAVDDTIQIVLVGCGGRGTGAAVDALSVKQQPIKLVALADVFADRLRISHRTLKDQFGDRADVPEDRQFLGFDAYKSRPRRKCSNLARRRRLKT